MPTTDRFVSDDPLPHFLSDRTDFSRHAAEREGLAEDSEPRESILLLNAGVLITTTALISIAITLSWGNPLRIFTGNSAPAIEASSVQPDTAQSAATLQATVVTRGLPPAATGAPTRDESPATVDSADQKQADSGAPAGALLGQFEAWAARQDGRTQHGEAQVEPRVEAQIEPRVEPQVEPRLEPRRETEAERVRPPEDASARSSQEAEAPVRSVHRHRTIRTIQNARAQMRSVRKPAPAVRRARPTQAETRPAQDARALEQPGQGAPPTSFTYWRQ